MPNHGFKYNLPDSVKDGKPHTLYMYAINVPDGANPLLGSKTITCDATHVCAANAVDGCRCASPTVCLGGHGFKCLNGQLVRGKCVSTSACAPNCSNKVCGQDGCGGSCGACGSGKACNGGVCAAQSPAAPMVSANPSNPSTPLISSKPHKRFEHFIVKQSDLNQTGCKNDARPILAQSPRSRR